MKNKLNGNPDSRFATSLTSSVVDEEWESKNLIFSVLFNGHRDLVFFFFFFIEKFSKMNYIQDVQAHPTYLVRKIPPLMNDLKSALSVIKNY